MPVEVLNTKCEITDSARLTSALEEVCKSGAPEPLSVDFTNVHIVAMRSVDEKFYGETSKVDWYVPDSQVLTWAVSLMGGRTNKRVYGPDFLDYFVRHGDTGLTHYFLGGNQECLDALLKNLKEVQPDLKIAGSRNGYFGAEDEASIIDDINAAKPDMLWVGLGTPKQQQWINANKDQLSVGAALAVGFAFDVNAGTKKDSPKWLGPLGLSWLYRLIMEPRRLWHRYLYYNSVFLVKLFRQFVSSCFRGDTGRNSVASEATIDRVAGA